MTKTLYDPKVEERGIEKGLEKGLEKGIELAKKVFKLYNQKMSIEEISKQCKMTEKEVKKILFE